MILGPKIIWLFEKFFLKIDPFFKVRQTEEEIQSGFEAEIDGTHKTLKNVLKNIKVIFKF